ncbi:MAG: hypothetical protein ACREOO_17620 [bacterium]
MILSQNCNSLAQSVSPQQQQGFVNLCSKSSIDFPVIVSYFGIELFILLMIRQGDGTMSVLELTEKELKSQLFLKLDQLNREQLLLIHHYASRLIGENLTDAVTRDWEMGVGSRASLQKAIEEHRLKNPYGESAS